ncbi:sigma-70 family RNA polymerase sigma factor [Paenibacillus sp. NEAU-GSW1]|uniref:sigma-70 family RNA polymerase sigma factor n=1 Tax=Paenibacillus sp. NEAU-GSW1 TaxID=2682486 RepID=UPI0020A67F34|nr:sigma-70 family RNA polymerase sigma factor [Paenibacillus sp. NEAU-GSW1]
MQQLYLSYSSLMRTIAYRMTGSFADAEDLVQDTFAEYSRLKQETIVNKQAYLARMITNRSINYMNSARKKRELYVGEWLPEPDVRFGKAAADDPADVMERKETISYALLVLLEQLSALERAVFILRETLQYDYEEIAASLGKTEPACRKLLSRAKMKLEQLSPGIAFSPERASSSRFSADSITLAFLSAMQTGNADALVALLTKDALLTSDGGGRVRAAIFTIIGSDRVCAFFRGLLPKGYLGDIAFQADINGQPGIIMFKDGAPLRTVSFKLSEPNADNERFIEHIYIVINPDKLQHVPLEVTNDFSPLSE